MKAIISNKKQCSWKLINVNKNICKLQRSHTLFVYTGRFDLRSSAYNRSFNESDWYY